MLFSELLLDLQRLNSTCVTINAIFGLAKVAYGKTPIVLLYKVKIFVVKDQQKHYS